MAPSNIMAYGGSRILRSQSCFFHSTSVYDFSGLDRVTPNAFVPMFNQESIRRGETPSGNGSCSARGLARLGAAVIADNDGLLSREAVEEMHAEPVVAADHGLGGGVTEFTQGGVNVFK